ncbi:MAG TPA: rhomboid family intramembrane serine protease [Bacteroidia bacterium]
MSPNEFRPGGFQLLSPVVKNILIISGILFLAQVVLEYKMNIDLKDYLGLHYYAADYFKPYQFVTYIFMHGNFMHIFFNMFAVWTFGTVLENVWGSKRFLIFYLLTGMGAALTQYVVYYFQITPLLDTINNLHTNMTIESFEAFINGAQFRSSISYETSINFNAFAEKYNAMLTSSDHAGAIMAAHDYLDQFKTEYLNANVIVGASGSLFGLLLAFGMLFPNTYLNIYFFIPIKAKYFVILYGAIEIYSAIANDQDNVAHFAHLGGMLFGFILIMLWKKDRTHFY